MKGVLVSPCKTPAARKASPGHTRSRPYLPHGHANRSKAKRQEGGQGAQQTSVRPQAEGTRCHGQSVHPGAGGRRPPSASLCKTAAFQRTGATSQHTAGCLGLGQGP